MGARDLGGLRHGRPGRLRRREGPRQDELEERRQGARSGGGEGGALPLGCRSHRLDRSEEHTSELQSLMRIPYAVFCLKQINYKHQYTSAIKISDINNKTHKQNS